MTICKSYEDTFGHSVKLSKKQSLKDDNELKIMARVPCASVIDSLMYAMVYTRPNIAHVVRVVCRYMLIWVSNTRKLSSGSQDT